MRTRNAPQFLDIDKHIAELKQQARNFRTSKALGEFRAAWLIMGQLGSSEWIISERVDVEPVEISFKIKLPDGSLLTAPQNKKCLILIQRIFFTIRCGHVQKANQKTCISVLEWLFKFTEWVYLHKREFEPEKYAFGKVTNDDIDALLSLLSENSWSLALQVVSRSLNIIHEGVYGCDAPTEFHTTPFNLPNEFLKAATTWLQESSAYSQRKGLVSRTWLAKKLKSRIHVGDKRLRAFLYQFEPQRPHARLLTPGSKTIKNHIDARTISLEAAASNTTYEKTFFMHLGMLSTFMKTSYIDSNSFPAIQIDKDSIKEYRMLYSERLMNSTNTPKIPYGIGMHVLTKAIEWVVLFGDAFVDMTLYIVKKLSERESLYDLYQTIDLWSAKYVTKSYPGYPSQSISDAFEIKALIPAQTAGQDKSFTHYLSAFMGACAVLIAMFKPIRQEELSSIKRTSLLTKNTGTRDYKDLLSSNPIGLTESLYTDEMYDTGAFIVHENKKAGVAALNPNICRPIPYISTLAIRQLQRLGDGLAALYEDTSYNSDRLFYFPSLLNLSKISHSGTAVRIDDALIRFSDAIDIPRNKDGTRWYVRTHEMRKFFIYTMYYHEPNYSADAIGWHAGHASAKQLGAYTSSVGVVDEVIELQTENVIDKLLAYELNQITEEPAKGLVGLYNNVLAGFNVKSIKLLPAVKFRDFVKRMIHERRIETSGYTISREMLNGSIIDTDIAIKFGEIQDANFVPR